FDHLFTENVMAGVSFAYTSTDIDLDDGQGSGDISGLGGSIYGGWFSDHAWIDTTFSYAHQDFDNRRQVTVGTIDRTATSDHDGDVLAASIEGGPRFRVS